MFEQGWSNHGAGFVLLDGAAVVGFMGTIVARRQMHQQRFVVSRSPEGVATN